MWSTDIGSAQIGDTSITLGQLPNSQNATETTGSLVFIKLTD